MQVDYVFLVSGAAGLLLAVLLGVKAVRSRAPREWLTTLCWAGLGAGLLLHAYAPHLKIENGVFVVPEKSAAGIAIGDPVGVVERERLMTRWSALLITCSAVGLAVTCRGRFVRTGAPAAP